MVTEPLPLASDQDGPDFLLTIDLAAVHLAQVLDPDAPHPLPLARIRQWVGRIRVWAHRYPDEVHRYLLGGRVVYDPEELVAAAGRRRPRVLTRDQTRM